MYDWLDELKEIYEGRRIREDAEDAGEVILKRHCASYNMFQKYEIGLRLLDRGYYTDEMLKELEEDYIADDESVRPTVVDDRHIEYNGETTSLSALAQKLKGFTHPVQGTIWFAYNGEKLDDLRKRIAQQE